MALLEVEGLQIDFHTYNGTVTAVHDNAFCVQHGEVLGIVGESGCGKSVTASSLMGLLPEGNSTVRAQRMILDGRDISGYKESDWREIRGAVVSMIFQDPMTSLNPILSIQTQLEEAIRQGQRHKSEEDKVKDITQRAIMLLEAVGIPSPKERLKQYPHEMSGGMRQRVVIAMALAGEPKLLIADEPTTALDVTTEAQILLVMKKLLQEEGMGMIFISHNLRVVAQLCDRVMVMYGGTKVEEGTVEEIFTNPRHPYTKGLLASLPHGKGRGELVAIGGQAPDLYHMPKGCAFHPRCSQAMKICVEREPMQEALSPLHTASCWLIEKERRGFDD